MPFSWQRFPKCAVLVEIVDRKRLLSGIAADLRPDRFRAECQYELVIGDRATTGEQHLRSAIDCFDRAPSPQIELELRGHFLR